jgi:DNA-directed RNA polymerase subunit RPC12/RpoP
MYLTKEHKDIVNKFKGEERKIASSLLEKYLRDYSIESISDINTLKEVIYYEIIQYRLQDKLNDFATQKTIPIQLVNVMHENSEAIIKLKNSLGLFSNKEKKTNYDVLKHLKKRFSLWLEENQASRTITCPHCSKVVLLKIRTKEWEAQKHPFFKDRVIYNKHLFNLFKLNKISKKDVADILETSEDYVDWVIEKIEKIDNTSGGSVSTEVQVSTSGPTSSPISSNLEGSKNITSIADEVTNISKLDVEDSENSKG